MANSGKMSKTSGLLNERERDQGPGKHIPCRNAFWVIPMGEKRASTMGDPAQPKKPQVLSMLGKGPLTTNDELPMPLNLRVDITHAHGEEIYNMG